MRRSLMGGLCSTLILSGCATPIGFSNTPTPVMEVRRGSVDMMTSARGTSFSFPHLAGNSINFPLIRNARKIEAMDGRTANPAVLLLTSDSDNCRWYERRNVVLVVFGQEVAAQEVGACNARMRLSRVDGNIIVVDDSSLETYRIRGVDIQRIRGAANAPTPRTPPAPTPTPPTPPATQAGNPVLPGVAAPPTNNSPDVAPPIPATTPETPRAVEAPTSSVTNSVIPPARSTTPRTPIIPPPANALPPVAAPAQTRQGNEPNPSPTGRNGENATRPIRIGL